MSIYKSTGFILKKQDHVQINMEYVKKNPELFNFNNYLYHIRSHPEKIYTVTNFHSEENSNIQYNLSGKMEGRTWFTHELVHIPNVRTFYELIKNMNIEEMPDIILLLLLKQNLNNEDNIIKWLNRKPAPDCKNYLKSSSEIPLLDNITKTNYNVGDKVRINIDAVNVKDFNNITFRYINEHPIEIYTITEIIKNKDNSISYNLSRFSKKYTWCSTELISITKAKNIYEQIVQSTYEELIKLLPHVINLISNKLTLDSSTKTIINFLESAFIEIGDKNNE